MAAIVFWGASNNTIYHNNFINNPTQAYDGSFNSPFSVNTWDNDYPSGGNYWSDYQSKYPSATEIDNSGIGNTPYIIDPNNTDRYPLLNQFDITTIAPTPTPTVPEFSSWAIPLLLIVTLAFTSLLVYQKKTK